MLRKGRVLVILLKCPIQKHFQVFDVGTLEYESSTGHANHVAGQEYGFAWYLNAFAAVFFHDGADKISFVNFCLVHVHRNGEGNLGSVGGEVCIFDNKTLSQHLGFGVVLART